jgi:hypothetical protein
VTPFGCFVVAYLLGFFLEIVNNAALMATELEISGENASMELLNPLALIKITVLTFLWPAGLVVKLFMVAEYASKHYGHNDLLEVVDEEKK